MEPTGKEPPSENEEFQIKSYNQKELAGHYQVTPKTFRKWLIRLKLDLGTRIGNYYSPHQVKTIVDKLGRPFIWIAAWFLDYDPDPDPDVDDLDTDHHPKKDGKGTSEGKEIKKK